MSAFAAESRTVVRPVSGTRLQRTDVQRTHFSLFVLNHNLFAVGLPGPRGVFIRKYQSVVCPSALFGVLIFFGPNKIAISRGFLVVSLATLCADTEIGHWPIAGQPCVSGAATSTTTGILQVFLLCFLVKRRQEGTGWIF